mmetsp:Transcript_648/g.2015  ORF Transcript_648/g.2015 Transcript_648/m.2015 type:complete len:342 (-) Transcript_648:47-1072(-)|eukprot:CAMPEP_0118997740 /NCGR_PEP_ID=MMETSP1173-20130426/62283_1 /TAXON_ID=1034831 /ORGANISM="Rhizochromulina marina cf, Strain CCMP1243" /LENGTH=341 /DNA_ID=CAMNT_0006949199 /DNA_START=107 /DNA_END=1132 /DNA_ORIENTATION=-
MSRMRPARLERRGAAASVGGDLLPTYVSRGDKEEEDTRKPGRGRLWLRVAVLLSALGVVSHVSVSIVGGKDSVWGLHPAGWMHDAADHLPVSHQGTIRGPASGPAVQDPQLVPLPAMSGRGDVESDGLRKEQLCRSTRQGQWLVADSNGAVCTRDDMLQSEDGCCPESSQKASLPCDNCSTSEQCCGSYEHCVACCLSPEHSSLRDSLQLASSHAAMRRAPSAFDFCSYKCRTSSGSTVRENSYRSPEMHCFGWYRATQHRGQSVNSDLSSRKEFSPEMAGSNFGLPREPDPYFENNRRVTSSGGPPPPPAFPCTLPYCSGDPSATEKSAEKAMMKRKKKV